MPIERHAGMLEHAKKFKHLNLDELYNMASAVHDGNDIKAKAGISVYQRTEDELQTTTATDMETGAFVRLKGPEKLLQAGKLLFVERKGIVTAFETKTWS